MKSRKEQKADAVAEVLRHQRQRGVLFEAPGLDDLHPETLSLYTDRVEWTKHAKMTRGVFKADRMTEVMPLESIASVVVERDGLLASELRVHGSGNSIEFKSLHAVAASAKVAILQAMATARQPGSHGAAVSESREPETQKTCPMCAEDVKSAARICRYCGHSFPESTPPYPGTALHALITCRNGHENHPSRSSCLVCESQLAR